MYTVSLKFLMICASIGVIATAFSILSYSKKDHASFSNSNFFVLTTHAQESESDLLEVENPITPIDEVEIAIATSTDDLAGPSALLLGPFEEFVRNTEENLLEDLSLDSDTGPELEESEVYEEETIEEYEETEEYKEEYSEPSPPVPSPIVRNFSNNIIVNENSLHRCSVEPFVVDISKSGSANVDVSVVGFEEKSQYVLEIGSLPGDIDARFETSNTYTYEPRLDEMFVSLIVSKRERPQNGSFSIPIFFTKKGENPSSFMCQINIINL